MGLTNTLVQPTLAAVKCSQNSTRAGRCQASTGAAKSVAERRRLAGVCFSSRQTQQRKEGKYTEEDEKPGQAWDFFPVRPEGESWAEFEEGDAAAFALELAGQANDTKAVDIRVLDVSKLVYWTRYFVVATCFSKPQVDACITRMQQMAETKYSRVLPNPPPAGTWVCLDFGDVVAHVFTPSDRSLYDVEGLYKMATDVPLPFVSAKGGGPM